MFFCVLFVPLRWELYGTIDREWLWVAVESVCGALFGVLMTFIDSWLRGCWLAPRRGQSSLPVVHSESDTLPGLLEPERDY